MIAKHSVSLLLLAACTPLAGCAPGSGEPAASPTLSAHRPEPEDPTAASRHELLMRSPDGRPVDAVRYEEALEWMADMPQRDSTDGPGELPSRRRAAEARQQGGGLAPEKSIVSGWSPLGPGNIGGRTRAFVIHPTRPTVMYAAGVAGGVWKTTTSGFSWAPTASMAHLAITTLAFNPSNPEVIYAGSGEGYTLVSGLRGGGIFKTASGGTSWSRLASTGGNPDFYYVSKVLVSPRDTRVVYAATNGGVFRSLDAGTRFARILGPLDTTGCQDLALRPAGRTDVLFAACGMFRAGADAAVFRSLDAAARNAADVVFETVLTEPGMGRTALAIAPSNPQVIYAIAAKPSSEDTTSSGLHGVFRSTTGGGPAGWTARVRGAGGSRLVQALLSEPRGALGDICKPFDGKKTFANQGWYDLAIAVDPTDSSRLWIGGVDLFRSDNGGATWGAASYWEVKGLPSWAHADQHVIAFHPRYDGRTVKALYVGNDGGLFFTLDATRPVATTLAGVCRALDPGGSKVAWVPLNNNYQVTQFYSGMPYPDGGGRLLGGTQDNGTVRGTWSSRNGWAPVLGGDGGSVAVDPGDDRTIYAAVPRGRIAKSTDGGASFGGATNGLYVPPDGDQPEKPNDRGFPFVTLFVMDPSDPQTLWLAGSRLWRSRDGAGSWVPASTAPSAESISAIAVNPDDSDHVVAGSVDGYVLRSFTATTTGGTSAWSRLRLTNCAVSSLSFDPSDPRTLYATCSTFDVNHVWRSVDRGRSFWPLDGSGSARLPNLPVLALAVDPTSSSRLFVGTDLGVFSSSDGGARWAVETTGFPNTRTVSLSFVRRGTVNRELWAFTHGRGAWMGEIH